MFQIRDRDIDNKTTRAGNASGGNQSTIGDLLGDRALLTFSLVVFLFYAANAALAIGFLAKTAGFSTAFFTLAAIASIGTLWLWLAMPETK